MSIIELKELDRISKTVDKIEKANGISEPQEDDIFNDLWVMTYRSGTTINTKGFSCSEGFHAAYKKAFAHCGIMGFGYLFIRPMISNLEEDEKRKLER